MPSPQSVLVNSALRRLVKPRHSGEVNVCGVRSWVDRLASLSWPHTEVSIQPLQHASLVGEWISPPRCDSGRVVLYLHGGGYFFCTPRTYRPVTSGLSRALGASALSLQYRLAPEFPYPAALEDALQAYRWLLGQGWKGEQIALAGDSAGGGLALATLLRLREAGDTLPAACALFSPWTDLAATGASLESNDRNCAMFSADMIRRARHLYLGQTDPLHPHVSPLYADLRGLPPLLIHVSDNEVLLDDSTRLAERARQAGVEVDLKIWSRQPHVWQLFSRFIPEGRRSLKEAGAFFDRHLPARGGANDMPFSLP